MSLDWSAKNIAGWDEWTDNPDNWQKFQSIVFGCMVTHIGEIKNEADALEWFTRYSVWNNLNGYSNDFITLADVEMCVGLSTNVFPRKTDDQWCKLVMTRALEYNRDRIVRAKHTEERG